MAKWFNIAFFFVLIINNINFIKSDIFLKRKLISCAGGNFLKGNECFQCKEGNMHLQAIIAV